MEEVGRREECIVSVAVDGPPNDWRYMKRRNPTQEVERERDDLYQRGIVVARKERHVS